MATLFLGSAKVCSDLPCVSIVVFSRERVANASHVRRPCKVRHSGYVAMSPCHAARAVAALLKSILRFGALAG